MFRICYTHFWPIDVCHRYNEKGSSFEKTLVEKRGMTGKNILREDKQWHAQNENAERCKAEPKFATSL